MPGPWEKYQASAPKVAEGPWDKYKQSAITPTKNSLKDGQKIPDELFTHGPKDDIPFLSGEGGTIMDNAPGFGPLARKAGEYFRAGTEYVGRKAFGEDKPYADILADVQGENDTRHAKFAKEHPTANIAREIVGGVAGAGMVPIPGANVSGKILGPLARMAGVAGLNAADTGLRSGSLSEMRNAAILGGGAQAIAETVPVFGRAFAPISRPLGSAIKDIGEGVSASGAGRAVKAAFGNVSKAYEQMGNKRIVPAGELALEKGVVSFGDTAGNIAKKADVAGNEAWTKAEEIFKQADAAGVRVEGRDIAKNIRSEKSKIEPSPQNESRINSLEKTAAYFESRGQIKLSDAQRSKMDYDWKKVDPVHDILGKNGNNLVNRAIGDSIKDTVKASGLPGSDDFVKNYQAAGTFSALEKGALKTQERLTKNRSPFSLTDYLTGGAVGGAAAAITGDAKDTGLAGIMAATANSLARTRGNSALAVSLSKVGKIIATKPEQLGKFYKILEKAAESGAASLATTHAMLLQRDPEYKNIIEPSAVSRRIEQTRPSP